MGRGECKPELASGKQGAEVLANGLSALNRWMVRGHQHSIGRPDGDTAIGVRVIHGSQQFRRCSHDGRTINFRSIRIVHTLALHERPRRGIDTIDPAYYTVSHGDGQTTAASEADGDVGRDTRSAAHRRAPVLRATESDPRNADFDAYVESLCQRFYADEVGRPGLPPGRYFRLLLIGYFEGLDAERAIAWRAADSFALREFLGVVLPEAPPDHSTISRTRRLIDLETHEAVFTWILQRLADAGLVKGKTIGIDATTLEANAALRSIVRRDTGATYQDF